MLVVGKCYCSISVGRAMFEAEFTRKMAMRRWRGVLNDVRGEVRGTGRREVRNFDPAIKCSIAISKPFPRAPNGVTIERLEEARTTNFFGAG